MKIGKNLAITISSVVCVLATVRDLPVLAANFAFSYTGVNVLNSSDIVSASGILTTSDYNPQITFNSDGTDYQGGYQIIGISGTRNGSAIESLVPVGGINDNTNILIADSAEDTTVTTDDFGFAYRIGNVLYTVVDSYIPQTEIGYYSDGGYYGGYALIAYSVTEVPEPSSVLASMLGISLLTGSGLRKRKLKIADSVVSLVSNYAQKSLK